MEEQQVAANARAMQRALSALHTPGWLLPLNTCSACTQGVALTHANLLYQLEALAPILGARAGQTSVTYLPPWCVRPGLPCCLLVPCAQESPPIGPGCGTVRCWVWGRIYHLPATAEP